MRITPPHILKAKRRRYRLHSRIKKFCRMNARSREVFVTELILSSLTKNQTNAINELRDKFNYNIQYIID